MFSKFLILSLLLVSCLSSSPRDLPEDVSTSDLNLNCSQKQYWFTNQLVDHFDLTRNDTFDQRYWVISDYFDEHNGPVFLILCGEAACEGIRRDRLFALELAQEFHALIIVLEHRFYGLSQPFGDKNLTVQRLKYLTVDQALADIAYFLQWTRTTQNLTIHKNPTRPYITIGGSYAGALSAWFRQKYPYLTIGAIASSAVINSFVDFWQFDYQVYQSLMKTPLCAQNFQVLSNYVEDQLQDEDNALDIKKQFNATDLSDEEFLWFWADTIAEAVQYGKRTHICNLLEAYHTLDAQLKAVKEYTLHYNNAVYYGAEHLAEIEFREEDNGARQWAWQSCSELGWFQTAPVNETIAVRSQKLDLEFFREWCADIFGEGIFPDAAVANMNHGGKCIDTYNLIISNGAEDPWQQASLTERREGIDEFYIDCENCGHCVDLHTPSPTDSWALWWERVKVKAKVAEWLARAREPIFLN